MRKLQMAYWKVCAWLTGMLLLAPVPARADLKEIFNTAKDNIAAAKPFLVVTFGVIGLGIFGAGLLEFKKFTAPETRSHASPLKAATSLVVGGAFMAMAYFINAILESVGASGDISL